MTTAVHPDDDLLLDLVSGLISGGERNATLAHLRECGSCASRLREFAATHERAYAHAAAAIADWPEERRDVHVLRVPPPLASRPSPALLVAAGLIAVVGVTAALWLSARQRAPAGGPVAWLPSPEANVLTRDSSEAPPDPRIVEGLAAYRLHDAATARRLLERSRAQGALEQVRRLYLGNADLQLGQPGAALDVLESVDLGEVPEPWRSEAEWSLSLAYSRTGRTRAADSLWQLLSDRPGEVGERARRAQAAHPGTP